MSGTAANTDTGENRDDMTNSNANLSPGGPSPHSLGVENLTSPLALSTITSGANNDNSFREAIDVAVVSLARYTFADPGVAEAGPAPLDPPIERPRLLGVDQPPLAAVSVQRAAGNMGIARSDGDRDRDGNGDDGLIAEFTEDRCHRQLAMIAKRLLLPDSYIEACYDLHQFLDTNTAMLDVEAVQRNVFKCLKICARLSKLHGYNIQLMWQIIQQAHRMIARFTPERAHTINLWHIKMTNRIRMMAVAPASDGSAPPRLPSVPPRELLQAQAREKLLPLPEMSVSALNDSRFNRAAGTSSASYYLANSLASQRQSLGQSQTQSQILPPIMVVGRSSVVDTGVSQGAGFNGMMTAADYSGSASSPGSGSGSGAFNASALLPPLAPLAPAAEPNGAGSEFGFNPGPVSNHYNRNNVSEGAPTASSSTTTTTSSASASTSSSMREAELAIIEQQLRELENMPPESMGPMLRAALNLLVEMRFRLQLGLPRIAIADGAQNERGAPAIGAPTSRHHQSMQAGGVDSDMVGLSNPVRESRAVTLNGHRRYSSSRINANDEVFGANAEDESRVIEYVLNQISTSRRQQQQQQQQSASSSNEFGAPLYMMPHHTGMYYPRNNGFAGANSYLNLFPESQTQTPDNRPRGARRRRGFDDQEAQNSQDDGSEDDDISGESEEAMDDSSSDGDSGSGNMSDDIHSLSDINADSSGSSDESGSDHFEQDMQGRGGRSSQHYQRDDEHVHRRVRRH
ncbi:hypothetical protein BX661DRAFT_11982 [Kickxella alabastrina]|uniref:uncharacterized protein n=1 Tax=Kickxella alabastrina TaxID=61397 RepID=UPI00221E90BF|nr:uncharacterized protein BX661DRAFT_11982 [Kickxella alabastrina]KAI7835219.1 hypothetical protein BX661DRAFT_11982 [Kickxella alabastrina]